MPGAAARVDRCQRPGHLRAGHLAAAVRAAAARGPRPLLRREPLRPLLVGDALQRHHERSSSTTPTYSSELRRHPGRGPARRHEARQLHPHGPAAPHGAAQDGRPGRGPEQPRELRGDDPGAHPRRARRLAAQRDLRLGGQGLDRAHHHDAGDAVRLPVGGAPQAHLLVGCRHLQRQLARRAGAFRGGALCRASAHGRVSSRDSGRSGRRHRRSSTSSR